MSLKTDLIAARSLIIDREHWTTQVHAATRDGNAVYHDEPNAYCFCADGALGKACGVSVDPQDGEWRDNARYNAARDVMHLAADQIFGKRSYVDINDGTIGIPDDATDGADLDIAHANILQVFDRAIDLVP